MSLSCTPKMVKMVNFTLHIFNYNWKNHKGGKSNLTVGVTPSPSHIPLVRASRRPLPHSRGGGEPQSGRGSDTEALFSAPDRPSQLRTFFPDLQPCTISPSSFQLDFILLPSHDVTLAHAFPVAKSALLWSLTFIPFFPGPTQMPPPPGNLPLPPEALTLESAWVCSGIFLSLTLNFPICTMDPMMSSSRLCCEVPMQCQMSPSQGSGHGTFLPSFLPSSGFC